MKLNQFKMKNLFKKNKALKNYLASQLFLQSKMSMEINHKNLQNIKEKKAADQTVKEKSKSCSQFKRKNKARAQSTKKPIKTSANNATLT